MAANTDRAARAESGGWGETLKTVAIALAIALVIRVVLFQPFNIPSGSMKSTLLVGDFLFVSKMAYGYSRHSLPFSPPLPEGRIFGSLPERGDVVVFKLPQEEKTAYIKRVIGVPGDRIQVKDSALFLNGEQVERTRVDDFVETDVTGYTRRIPRYRETLPDGTSYFILDELPNGHLDNTREFLVPDGHLFMMGDNRDQSLDSRVQDRVGFIPVENVVGRADFLFFSKDAQSSFLEFWKLPTAIRWNRLFNGVH